jgi:short-subunit dehydrogenase
MSSSTKAILITGCSTGIGLCVAKGLKKRGYRVFATARNPEDVENLKNEELESFVLDLNDSNSIRETLNKILEQTDGKLFGLFNNAGFGQPGAVEDLTRQALREQFETNVLGLVELTNLILPIMRKQGSGRIIQNSSVLGFVVMPFRGAYSASKFALEGISDALRIELADTNIFVSLVEPGPIESKFRDNAYKKFRENIDIDKSPHKDRYQAMISRLTNETPSYPFTLPPEAVLKKVIDALENPKPKPRYYVTFPTYLFAYLKRILPQSLMDFVLTRASNAEAKKY